MGPAAAPPVVLTQSSRLQSFSGGPPSGQSLADAGELWVPEPPEGGGSPGGLTGQTCWLLEQMKRPAGYLLTPALAHPAKRFMPPEPAPHRQSPLATCQLACSAGCPPGAAVPAQHAAVNRFLHLARAAGPWGHRRCSLSGRGWRGGRAGVGGPAWEGHSGGGGLPGEAGPGRAWAPQGRAALSRIFGPQAPGGGEAESQAGCGVPLSQPPPCPHPREEVSQAPGSSLQPNS